MTSDDFLISEKRRSEAERRNRAETIRLAAECATCPESGLGAVQSGLPAASSQATLVFQSGIVEVVIPIYQCTR